MELLALLMATEAKRETHRRMAKWRAAYCYSMAILRLLMVMALVLW